MWLSPAAGLGWLLYSLRGQDKRQAAAGLFKKANAAACLSKKAVKSCKPEQVML